MRSRRDLEEAPELWKYTKDGNYEIIKEETAIRIATSSGPQTRNYTYEGSLNYDRKFGSHTVTGTLAYNRLEAYVETDVANLPTGYVNYVGRVTYGYKGKYLAEINAGYNGSVQFAKNKRYGLFPAVSAGWVASEEDFWGKNSVVNYLKLRGAYGEVGNDRIGSSKYLYLQTYPQVTSNRPSFGATNQPENYIYEGTLGSYTVGWERARKTNVGIDMRLFNSKMSFTADVFREIRSDILDYDRWVSTIFGMLSVNDGNKGFAPQNIGKVQNQGFEVDLGYGDKISDLKYYVRGNFTFARNEIKKIGETPVTYPWLSKIGKPVNQRFGLICDGFYNTQEEIEALPSGFSGNLKPGDLKYRDINGDGKTDDYDLVPIGRTQLPEIMYGLTLGGEWKGVDLQVFLQGSGHSDIYVNGYGYWEFTNTGSVMEHHLGRWTPQNKEKATYPSLSPATSEQNHRLSTFWLKDGKYLRLKNVQVGYSFPAAFLRQAKISGLRVYVSGTNLLTFSKVREYDPESNDGDGSVYPQMKSITAGINLKF
jgi:TonB-linked SusC/RagA family outer membrane protein